MSWPENETSKAHQIKGFKFLSWVRGWFDQTRSGLANIDDGVSGSRSAADPRRRFGDRGEALAARYLAAAGYEIVARGWRPGTARAGELDIVALERGLVVFVEVKTRRSAAFGRPEEAVTSRKREALRRLAVWFLAQRGWSARPFRIDVIAIEPKAGAAGRWCLRHLKNAVGAGEELGA